MLLSLLTEIGTNPWKYSIPNCDWDQEELPIYLWGDLKLQICWKSSNESFSGKKRDLKPTPCRTSSFPEDPQSHEQEAKVTCRVQSPGAEHCSHHINLPQSGHRYSPTFPWIVKIIEASKKPVTGMSSKKAGMCWVHPVAELETALFICRTHDCLPSPCVGWRTSDWNSIPTEECRRPESNGRQFA